MPHLLREVHLHQEGNDYDFSNEVSGEYRCLVTHGPLSHYMHDNARIPHMKACRIWTVSSRERGRMIFYWYANIC